MLSGTAACTALLGDFSVGPDPGPTGNDAGDGGEAAGAITPGDAKVPVLRTQKFEATGAVAAGGVTWSITEGAAGGFIDDTGKYVAPVTPGKVHVVATNKATPSLTVSLEVTVVPLALSILAGIPGGTGYLDGPARQARFHDAYGLAYLANPQTMLISDTTNKVVRKWDKATDTVTTIAGQMGVDGESNGIGEAATFRSPADLAIDDLGKTAWIADRANHCIRTINLLTREVTTLAGVCGTANAGHADGATGSQTVFDQLGSMILGPAREALYIFDYQAGGAGYKGIRRVLLSGVGAGGTTSITNGMNSAYMSGDFASKKIYFNDSTGQIKSIVDSVGGPGSPPTISNVASGAPQASGIVAQIGGTANEIYSFYANPFISHFHIGNAAFDAAPFVGVTSEPRYVDGTFVQARFTYLTAMAGDAASNNLFAYDHGGAVRRIDIGASTVSTMLGSPANSELVNGAKDTARLLGPMAIVQDVAAGKLYVADDGQPGVNGQVIRVVDIATGAIDTLSGVPSLVGGGGINGGKSTAKFGGPYDMVKIGGDLYVTDVYGHAIRKVSIADGSVTTPYGQLNTFGGNDGIGNAAHFNFASAPNVDQTGFGAGLATDGTDLYVADGGNYAIRKITIATGEVKTIVGGTKGNGDGTGTAAQFVLPTGIALDKGVMYVADSGANVIKRVDMKTLEVTTWAGFANVAGKTDGGSSVASFTAPFRIVADGNGSLFVSEAPPQYTYVATAARVIRQIDIRTRTVSTFVGTRKTQGLAIADLPAATSCPGGITISDKGDLMFADYCEGAVAILKPHL